MEGDKRRSVAHIPCIANRQARFPLDPVSFGVTAGWSYDCRICVRIVNARIIVPRINVAFIIELTCIVIVISIDIVPELVLISVIVHIYVLISIISH